MNTMLAFAPFLALVAFLSMEVSAEVLKYTQLPNATDASLGENYNSFTSLKYSYTTKVADKPTTTDISVIPASGGCSGFTPNETITCDLPAASNDFESMVEITAVVPPAAELSVAEGVGKPVKIFFEQCFSPEAAAGRKWRKLNDPFKKDNSCKTGSTAPDAVDYPQDGGEVKASYKLGGKTPTAQMTIRASVRCEGQIATGDDDQEKLWCHVVNRNSTAGSEVYFPTEVIDNRPAGLYTAVFICAFIGPILLAAFLVYERGVLANQKSK